MKRFFSVFIFSAVLAYSGYSQSKAYFTSGGEMIFSLAKIEYEGGSESSILRWAPFFNAQSMVNLDLNKNIGIFSGLAIRNVGFIYGKYKVYDAARSANVEAYTTYKKKFRTYNLAIPVGIKIGNLEKMFVYGGYEVEFPFHYKEKTFNSENDKTKKTEWFSDRVEKIQHGFLVGIQFPYGMNLKFKYYLSNFHNQDFRDSDGNMPYADLKANVFYFSLSSSLFKNMDFDSPVPDKKL